MHELLESPPLKAIVDRFSRGMVVSTVAAMLDEVRREVQNAATEMTLPSVTDLAERIVRRLADDESTRLRPVINATGILLHEQLGPATAGGRSDSRNARRCATAIRTRTWTWLPAVRRGGWRRLRACYVN